MPASLALQVPATHGAVRRSRALELPRCPPWICSPRQA